MLVLLSECLGAFVGALVLALEQMDVARLCTDDKSLQVADLANQYLGQIPASERALGQLGQVLISKQFKTNVVVCQAAYHSHLYSRYLCLTE